MVLQNNYNFQVHKFKVFAHSLVTHVGVSLEPGNFAGIPKNRNFAGKLFFVPFGTEEQDKKNQDLFPGKARLTEFLYVNCLPE